jgi:NAD(P)-dependent dehydrogenase (short-subunit alcohol dehydrogenase family)
MTTQRRRHHARNQRLGSKLAMDSKKYAIVTGAASGLGRALVIELARHGWHSAICDLNEAGAAESLELVRKAGGDGQVERLDVTKPDEWRALSDKLRAQWPHLDLLVNNAGVGLGGEVGSISLEDWHWIVNVNLWGAIYGCHTLIDWMKQNAHGSHIVNIASMAAIASAPKMAPYNITKAGMVSLSETLYGELAPYNIGATAVCPAFFPTNIVRDGRFVSPDQRAFAEKMLRESKATAEQVAKRILDAVENKQLYVFVPMVSSVFWRLKRLMPKTVLKMIARRNPVAPPTPAKG